MTRKLLEYFKWAMMINRADYNSVLVIRMVEDSTNKKNSEATTK